MGFLPLAPPGKPIVIVTLHLKMKKETHRQLGNLTMGWLTWYPNADSPVLELNLNHYTVSVSINKTSFLLRPEVPKSQG